jgi:hypothetical protein
MMDSAFDFLVFSLSGFIEIPDGGYCLSWMMGNFPTEKGRRWEGMEWEKFEIGIWIYLQRFRQGSRINGNPAGFRQKCVDCPAADDPEECLLFNEGRVKIILTGEENDTKIKFVFELREGEGFRDPCPSSSAG